MRICEASNGFCSARSKKPGGRLPAIESQRELSLMLEYGLIFLFPVMVTLAGVKDLLTFTIPNGIPLALLAGFFLIMGCIGIPWSTFLSHASTGLLVLLIGFGVFVRGWVGGGDAKLAAAIALWLGVDNVLAFLLWTAMLGGTLALLLLMYRRLFPPLWLICQPWAMRLHDPKEGIPYGVALAGAGLIVYPHTIWMTGIPG